MLTKKPFKYALVTGMSLGNFNDSDPGRQPTRTVALLSSCASIPASPFDVLLLLIHIRFGSCSVTTTLGRPPLAMRGLTWACMTAFPKPEGDPANSFTSLIYVGN